MTEAVQVENANKTGRPTSVEAKKWPRGQVFIYGRWCKGCHICVKFCPTGVLEMDGSGDHPFVAHPEKCTACHFCDTHCPDLAIVVKRIKD
jgi:2-oxoglutarate ferredoxin oxidoreductase subunit delta